MERLFSAREKSSVKIVEKYGERNPAAAMRNELRTITSFGRGESSLLLLDRREIESPRRRLISPLSWIELILDSRGLTDSTFRPPLGALLVNTGAGSFRF